MKSVKSKIRFIETFVIATFPLALAVGCTATGDPKPTDIGMQEDVTIQQKASIDANELNTLTFTDTKPTESTNESSGLQVATDSESVSEETIDNTQAMDSTESTDADNPIQASNETAPPESSLTPVNMSVPEHFTTDQSIQNKPMLEKPDDHILYFAVSKFDINEQDRTLLQQHADYLKENPGIVLTINGYSDSRGSAKLNFELSKKRAQQVADALINLGVNESQLKVNSYGESFPLHDEKNWDENRRVELQYPDSSGDDGLMASAVNH